MHPHPLQDTGDLFSGSGANFANYFHWPNMGHFENQKEKKNVRESIPFEIQLKKVGEGARQAFILSSLYKSFTW